MEEVSTQVRGVPTRSVALSELALLVEERPELIEHDPPNPVNSKPIEGLAAWRDFVTPGARYSSGTHIAIVEVDPETGEVHIISEAQVQGGLAQGIRQGPLRRCEVQRGERRALDEHADGLRIAKGRT